MESKPLITYAGDEILFDSLHCGVCQNLPVEPIEWRRSFGRAPKKVYVECCFAKFSEETLPIESDWKLLDQAFFHTFWTDCVDVDQYKAAVRDDISRWLTVLRNHDIHDWLIVCVETMDSHRKAAKTKLLPRASVLDKVKSDFCGRSQDSQRCVSLLDPQKSDARGAESWQSFLGRVRHLLLHAYNQRLSRFEEHMRSQRECRQEPEWSFCQYFLLQEELAFVFEMLGIYDDALVQYDELDALFTQFVLNSNAGDTPKWLGQFSGTCNSWRGMQLTTRADQSTRKRISDGVVSLLELRNYLFSRQCSLLLLIYRPWEVAQRTLPFLHNCINELRILEVTMPPGAIPCWVFMSAVEVLQTCERFNDSGQVENYSLYTAALWSYAKEKLQELGLLCGLMPLMSPTSEQLHAVVVIRTGMGDDDLTNDGSVDSGPVDKLREALSSKSAFQKHYIELSELAMSTFKHIKRMRSARLIGRDLADFYMKLGEPQKAATFLISMLETCINEKWDALAAQNRLDLVRCYEMSLEHEKCVKVCAQVASSKTLEDSVRKKYFQLMFSVAEQISKDSCVVMSGSDMLFVESVRLVFDTDIIISDTDVGIIVDIVNRFADMLKCDQLSLSLRHVKPTDDEKNDKESSRCDSPILQFEEHINRTQEFVGLICQNSHTALRRRDSQLGRRPLQKDDLSDVHATETCVGNNIVLEQHTLVPGNNVLKFHCKGGEQGYYAMGQMSIKVGRLEFVLPQFDGSDTTYRVVSEIPHIYLNKATKGDLVAGAEQDLTLIINTGSSRIEPDTTIRLQASKGLLLKTDDEIANNDDEPPVFMQSVECSLPIVGPFQTVTCKVKVLAEVPSQKDSNSFERKVSIISPWSMEKQMVQLAFSMPFLIQHKLHTTNTRKFVQLMVQGLQSDDFELCEPNLEVKNHDDVSVVRMNPVGKHLVVHKDQNACYVWELLIDNIMDSPTLQLTFTITYSSVVACSYNLDTIVQRPHKSTYTHQFELSNYKTLYTIHSDVEPIGGSKFCRMGSICHMNVAVACVTQRSTTSETSITTTAGDAPASTDIYPSLMYEVLADQMSWAVCGRTAGEYYHLFELLIGYCILTNEAGLMSGYMSNVNRREAVPRIYPVAAIPSMDFPSSGVISMAECGEHNVTLDVMPLTRGFLPVPNVRLSKYLAAGDMKTTAKDNLRKLDTVAIPLTPSPSTGTQFSRLEPFTQGQVFNKTKAIQVQVLPALGTNPNFDGIQA